MPAKNIVNIQMNFAQQTPKLLVISSKLDPNVYRLLQKHSHTS